MRCPNCYELCDWQKAQLEHGVEEAKSLEPSMGLVCYPILHRKWLEVIFYDIPEGALYRFSISGEEEWDNQKEVAFHGLCRRNDIRLIGCPLKKIWKWAAKRYRFGISQKIDHPGMLFEKVLCEENPKMGTDVSVISQRNFRWSLFSMGLEYLAVWFDQMEFLNLIGTNVVELFDGIRLDVLRSLNSRYGVRLLLKEDMRQKIYEIQEMHLKVFDHYLTELECIALELLLKQYGARRACKKFLNNRVAYQMIEKHQCWFDFLELIGKREDLIELFPFSDYLVHINFFLISEFLNLVELVNDHFTNPDYEPRYGMSQLPVYQKKFQYVDENYLVELVVGREQFYRESAKTNRNWLGYTPGRGGRLLLTVRESNTPEEPIVNIEIGKKFIMSVIIKKGEIMTPEMEVWIKHYADIQGLTLYDSIFKDCDARRTFAWN